MFIHNLIDRMENVVETPDECTSIQSGKNYVYQFGYRCTTCQCDPSCASNHFICIACAKKCHKGHDLVESGIMNAFCDCYYHCFPNHCCFDKKAAQELQNKTPFMITFTNEGKLYALAIKQVDFPGEISKIIFTAEELDTNSLEQIFVYHYTCQEEIRPIMLQQLIVDGEEDQPLTVKECISDHKHFTYKDSCFINRETQMYLTFHFERSELRLDPRDKTLIQEFKILYPQMPEGYQCILNTTNSSRNDRSPFMIYHRDRNRMYRDQKGAVTKSEDSERN